MQRSCSCRRICRARGSCTELATPVGGWQPPGPPLHRARSTRASSPACPVTADRCPQRAGRRLAHRVPAGTGDRPDRPDLVDSGQRGPTTAGRVGQVPRGTLTRRRRELLSWASTSHAAKASAGVRPHTRRGVRETPGCPVAAPAEARDDRRGLAKRRASEVKGRDEKVGDMTHVERFRCHVADEPQERDAHPGARHGTWGPVCCQQSGR